MPGWAYGDLLKSSSMEVIVMGTMALLEFAGCLCWMLLWRSSLGLTDGQLHVTETQFSNRQLAFYFWYLLHNGAEP